MNFNRDRVCKAIICSPMLQPSYGDKQVRQLAEDWLELSDVIESAQAGESAALEELEGVKLLLTECSKVLHTLWRSSDANELSKGFIDELSVVIKQLDNTD